MIGIWLFANVVLPLFVVGMGYVAVRLQERETERLKRRLEERRA